MHTLYFPKYTKLNVIKTRKCQGSNCGFPSFFKLLIYIYTSQISIVLFAECGYTKKATEQMDTYSFGVILLELVTGRPAEQMEETESVESLDVVKWVRRKINITNGESQVLDPRISNSSKHEILGALEIALCCTSVMPEKRPPMYEVLRALQCLGSRTRLQENDSSASDECSIPL